MSTQSVISVIGLTKVFRDFWQRARVRAVSDLDLSIEPGEIYGLLGPNGSGKSTTIKMILGLLYPTRGRITVFGKSADDVRNKTRIGYLPEESYLYRFLNARETLGYYGTLFQLPRRERNRRTEELLEMVGLKSAARRPVGEYSKGMARRIGLAQALINDPDLLILDEPTSGLDPVGSKLVKEIIVRIGQVYRKTILLSSHLLADVEEVCQRVTILFGGKVQVCGTMDEVLSRRDMMQITCERLGSETLREIEALIERREGKSIEVGVPRDRLESLFLRIVQQAHVDRVETAGSASPGQIAGFLGGSAAGREVLESLLKVEPTSRPPVPEPAAPPRQDVLQDLISAGPVVAADWSSAHAARDKAPASKTGEAPAPRATGAEPNVDRDLLSELSGPNEEKR